MFKRLTEILSNLRKKPDLDQFLEVFFSTDEQKVVVQIGANDGIQNDPLRKFLKTPGRYRSILVEPIPYYVDRLNQLYREREDIEIIQAAVGSSDDIGALYYIPSEVADKMNGDGPANNWAHGQGSFDRATVIHWIEANSFRGQNYRDNIPFFIDSIKEYSTPITKTDLILPKTNCDVLMVVDVQGFEIEVLNGIDWSCPPRWIVLEDDLGNTQTLFHYMDQKGFKWIAGNHDKVFECLS